MTGPGTNTYLVGIDEIVVIDPGPDDPAHLDAIAGCGGDRIRWIVCTHTHIDHFPGVAGPEGAHGGRGARLRRARRPRDRPAPRRRRPHRGHRVRAPGHPHARATRRTTSASCSSRSACCSPAITSWRAPRWSSGRPTATWPRTSSSSSGSRALRPRLRSIAPGHGHLIEQPAAKIDEYLEHRAIREAQVLGRSEPHGADHGRRHRRPALPGPRRGAGADGGGHGVGPPAQAQAGRARPRAPAPDGPWSAA